MVKYNAIFITLAALTLFACEKHSSVEMTLHELTINLPSGGMVELTDGINKRRCSKKCTFMITEGTKINLQAIKPSNLDFSYWKGVEQCYKETACSFSLHTSKVIDATFVTTNYFVNFNLVKDKEPLNQKINIINQSSDNLQDWEWDFNEDGVIDSTDQFPSYSYTKSGTYDITLKASNGHKTLSKTVKNAISIFDKNSTIYDIGPNQPFTSTHEIDLHKLKAGDTVRIYPKHNNEPYFEKLYINGQGTINQPIRIIGMPDEQGNLPIFDGLNSKANPNYGNYYYNEDRQIILIGQMGKGTATYISLENLEVRNAIKWGRYISDKTVPWKFAKNAAGIRISGANNIQLKNVNVHNNENGIFSSNSKLLTIKHSHIYDNGTSTSSTYAHNIYLDGGLGSVAVIEFNHIGNLLNDGQQFKSRAETLIFRYNWLEGGKNSLLDLVESEKNGQSDAYVYGNVLIKQKPMNNSRIIHFGGDQGKISRTGTLYFYNNTVLTDTDRSYLFQLNEEEVKVIAYNNIFYYGKDSTDKHNVLSPYVKKSELNTKISGKNNLFSKEIKGSDRLINNQIIDRNIFEGVRYKNYIPISPFIFPHEDKDILQKHPVLYQYSKHKIRKLRSDKGAQIGAFSLE